MLLSDSKNILKPASRGKSIKEYLIMVALNLIMSFVRTIMHGKAYKKEKFSPSDQKLLFIQECVRQSISSIIWLSTTTLSFFVIKRFFPNQTALTKLLMTNLLSSIPDAFVRPPLTAKFSKLILEKKGYSSISDKPVQVLPIVQKSQSVPVAPSVPYVSQPLFNSRPVNQNLIYYNPQPYLYTTVPYYPQFSTFNGIYR